MTRDRIIIFMLVGVMMFSAVATGLFFIVGNSASQKEDDITNLNDNTKQQDTDQNKVCEVSAEIVNQAGAPAGEWPTKIESSVSELQKIDLRAGSGKTAAIGNCITVHYRLALADGTPIAGNDTFATGQPIAFELNPGGLIEGWIKGIPGLAEGGLRRLIVPANLAYGETERPGIPANSDLVFDVELVKIEY